MNKIANIIEKEIGRTGEMMVLEYLMNKGIENLKMFNEDDIKTVNGNALMTKEYCQSIVRCAVRIAEECESIDIFKYIRCKAWFSPAVNVIQLVKDAISDCDWEYLCEEMDMDPDETDYINLNFISEVE